jgi:hypothetical protein
MSIFAPTIAAKFTSLPIRDCPRFDKWETYGIAFDHMEARHIRLTDIIEIAGRVAGITEDVVIMRRCQWVGMR